MMGPQPDVHPRTSGRSSGILVGLTCGSVARRVAPPAVSLVAAALSLLGGTSDALAAPNNYQLPYPTGYSWDISGNSYGCNDHRNSDAFAIDFGLTSGSSVTAVLPGTVQLVNFDAAGYGWYVVLSHWWGLRSVYAHLTSASVAIGTAVAQGQVIGASGSTGKMTTGPHLHFALRNGGTGPYDGTALRPEPMSGWTGFGSYGVCNNNGYPTFLSTAAQARGLALSFQRHPTGYSSFGYVLSMTGSVSAFGGASNPTNTPYWNGDVARSIAWCPSQGNGYVLDAVGGIHGLNGASDIQSGPHWNNWDIARAIVLEANCTSGYVLDGYGGVHPFGGAPAITSYSYFGWDIARAIVIQNDAAGAGYVLDGYGGVHPFNNAPPVTGYSYWPNQDIARGITLSATSPVQGYVADAWGGVHWFYQSGGTPPISLSGNLYWPNQDVARGIQYNPADIDQQLNPFAQYNLEDGEVGTAQ
jgi:hypothetical protein